MWEHTLTNNLVTFLGQILENTHIHCSHGSSIDNQNWSHFWDKFWKIHTYICDTVGKWEHTHTDKLITFLGQIWEKTLMHLSHGGDVGAYAPTKAGHIFTTNLGKYTHTFVTLLGNGSIHTHKSWSHFWDKF